MIGWLKSKTIIILSLLLVVSVAFNVVAGFIIFKNGLKITKNDYITTISKSYSSSSSGALSMNVIGQQQYWNGKYKIVVKRFESTEEMIQFMNTMTLPEWALSKPVYLYGHFTQYELYWPKFVEEKSKKEGTPTKIYKEVLDK